MIDSRHWDRVYGSKGADAVSWYQGRAEISLRLIQQSVASTAASIIDVGGGASTLVDDLLDKDYASLSVLDLSATALGIARTRLGDAAGRVQWLEGDITTLPMADASYDVWHDRAVFHFLIAETQRHAYVQRARKALVPGGHLIVSTFSHRGPTRCSDLPVVRYSPDDLSAEFGDGFILLEHEYEQHSTPAGSAQEFVYCVFQRRVQA